jgi:hypothetical protein
LVRLARNPLDPERLRGLDHEKEAKTDSSATVGVVPSRARGSSGPVKRTRRPGRGRAAPLRLAFGAVLAFWGCSRSEAAGVLRPTDPRDLEVSSGGIERLGPTRFAIRYPTLRAELGALPRASAAIRFVYDGPSLAQAPLASGELRRQIGLKLRAHDTCNVVYVMWQIEPAPRIEVSVKTNPGQRTHAQCRDRGYRFLRPTLAKGLPPPIRAGERHSLQASIAGRRLRVTADAALDWLFTLPPEALAFDGPVGMRADNGRFHVEFRASDPDRELSEYP